MQGLTQVGPFLLEPVEGAVECPWKCRFRTGLLLKMTTFEMWTEEIAPIFPELALKVRWSSAYKRLAVTIKKDVNGK